MNPEDIPPERMTAAVERLALAMFREWASYSVKYFNMASPRWQFLREDIKEIHRENARRIIISHLERYPEHSPYVG